jgi:NAD kinase
LIVHRVNRNYNYTAAGPLIPARLHCYQAKPAFSSQPLLSSIVCTITISLDTWHTYYNQHFGDGKPKQMRSK